MGTNKETSMETNGDYMETKCPLLWCKIEKTRNQKCGQNVDKLVTKWRQKGDKMETKKKTKWRQKRIQNGNNMETKWRQLGRQNLC